VPGETRWVEQALDPATAARAYRPGSAYDEAYTAAGAVRSQYADVIECLSEVDLPELWGSVSAGLAELGMAFRTSSGVQPFRVDPVPRIITGEEWECLERGLAQRTRALNVFLADVWGDRRIVDAGRLPERVLEGLLEREPDARAIAAAGGTRAHVAGFDVVRDSHGELRVLEDNLRTPSGLAYIECGRHVLDERLPFAAPGERADLELAELLGEALRAASPRAGGEPNVVLLSDGPDNSAWWEHLRLAGALGIQLVQPHEVEVRGGRVIAPDSGPVDVVYRRTDEDRLRDASGRLTWVGELLLEPLVQGNVACVNGFGTGVADDKLVHAYVEEMVRFYLGEEPAIRSVETYDPGEWSVRRHVLQNIDELVVKPRDGSGGAGVIVCPHASAEDRARAAHQIRSCPEAFIAQETILLSTHPTVTEGLLEPRHIDLRAFAFQAGEEVRVLAGGLTRVAFDAGALVVNSSQNGGGKDTWVLR
jgi:uncharacterized circularly permuted ATP-grasp superfamily protein